jgi:HSP20 family molecular chaperone IbpA
MTTQVAKAEPAVRTDEPFPRLMDWFENLLPSDVAWRGLDRATIKVEEFTRDGRFVVRAELPGIDPEKDVDVSVTDGMLTIRAERREEHTEERRSEFVYGRFVRTLTLPSGVDESAITAEYKDGILEVSVPMPEPVTAPTRIAVTRAE